MSLYVVEAALSALIACGYSVTGVSERSYGKALLAVAWAALAGLSIAKAVL